MLTVPYAALQYAAASVGTALLALYRALQFAVFLFVIVYGVGTPVYNS
jgi:hypothetical protein